MVKIVIAGDILIANSSFDIGFGILEKVAKEGNTDFIAFANRDFQAADLSIANLEFVISDVTPRIGIKSNMFLAPTSFLQPIKKLGIDIFSVANNHIMQHQEIGFYNTIDSLEKIGVKTIGFVKKPYEILEVKGIKIGIISASSKYDPFVKNPYNYYINIFPSFSLGKKDYDAICKELNEHDTNFLKYIYKKEGDKYIPDINKIRRNIENEVLFYEILIDAYCNNIIENNFFKLISDLKNKCDFLFVYMHWGDEYIHMPSKWQIQLGHKLVELGAQLIAGCHSHTIQGMETYKNTPIIYSLGNFYFNSNNPIAKESLLLEVYLDKNDSQEITMNYKFKPYRFNEKLMYPVRTNNKDSEQIIDKFNTYSSLVGKQDRVEYIRTVSEGIRVSRKYKKLHLLKNIFKMKLRTLCLVGADFVIRKTKRLIIR